jgi:MFS family permease
MPGIFALAVAYVLSQFYRSFLAVLTPALTADLGATKADLSLASGIYFLTFALAQFPIGVSLDRFGPRLTCAVLLAAGGAGGALVFSLAQSPWMVVAAMALIGIGCAPVLMASLFIFARIYTPARFAVLISWLIAFGALGNVVGASPLANAAQALGWRPVMAGLGLFTLLSALSILLLVRDPPAPQDMNPDGRGLRGYLDLLKIPVLWPIIPITALNYAPPIGIRGLWAGPYLQDVYGADAITIGNITFFMALAMVAGNFIYGPLDTLLRTRKWVGVGGTALALAALGYLALNVVTDTTMVTLLLIIIGPRRRRLRPADGACAGLFSTTSLGPRRHPDEFLHHWWCRHHAVRDGVRWCPLLRSRVTQAALTQRCSASISCCWRQLSPSISFRAMPDRSGDRYRSSLDRPDHIAPRVFLGNAGSVGVL